MLCADHKDWDGVSSLAKDILAAKQELVFERSAQWQVSWIGGVPELLHLLVVDHVSAPSRPKAKRLTCSSLKPIALLRAIAGSAHAHDF